MKDFLQKFKESITYTRFEIIVQFFTTSFCDEFERMGRTRDTTADSVTENRKKRIEVVYRNDRLAGQHATDERQEYSAREHRSRQRGDDTRYALLRARSVTQPARNAILLHIRPVPPPPRWPSPTTSFATRKAPLSWKIAAKRCSTPNLPSIVEIRQRFGISHRFFFFFK